MNSMLKFLVGALLLLGLPGTVMAGSCESSSATFSSSIGSTTTCSSISSPNNESLDGCQVGSGGTTCSYTGTECDFRVNVVDSIGNSIGVGDSQDKSTTYTIDNPGSSKPTCQVKFAITRGNQASSYCRSDHPMGTSGDTMTTKGNNGNPITHRQLEICTDEGTVAVSAPVVSIEKTVGREEEPGVFDCTDSFDQISVIAGDPSTNPTEVIYCYTIRNDGLGRLDALVDSAGDSYFIKDNNGTIAIGDDFIVYGCENAAGTAVSFLDGGDSCTAISDPRTIPNTVERVVNEAKVEGEFQGGPCDTCTDIDTATVNVVVQCDADTQDEADATGKVVERLGRQGTTRCAPRETTTIVDSGVGLLCDDTCAPRPECVSNPTLPHCSDSDVLQCKPSGNWAHTNALGDWTPGVPSPGKRPLCSEVLRNITNSDDVADRKNPVLTFANGRSVTVRTNPYLYYFPSSGGGNSIGTIYCILYPNEVAANVCPEGSIVY